VLCAEQWPKEKAFEKLLAAREPVAKT